MAAAPAQQQMATSASLEPYLGNKQAILVKQTMRGCCQECMGCEAKSEYKISAMDFNYMETGGVLKEGAMTQPDEMYVLEESSFCMRCCWRDGRPMDVNVTAGAEAGGAPIISYKKPCGCPITFELDDFDCPCCCFLPEMSATVDGSELKSKYLCDQYCCVSKFSYSEDGNVVYIVQPDTCCGGCCPTCRCQRGKPMIPYFFHDPETMTRIDDGKDEENQPQIRKVWAGFKKECCSSADTFAVFFPQGADLKRKAGLLGLTFLIDFTIFERQGDGQV